MLEREKAAVRRKSKKKLLVFIWCSIFCVSLTVALMFPVQANAKKAKRSRVIRLEELVVRGRIHKPEAMIILQRSIKARIFEESAKKKKFTDRILLSVNDPNLD